MLQPRQIARFAVLAVVFYLGLSWVRPYVERSYADVFRWGANMVFSRFWFWEDGRVRFLDLHSDNPYADLDRAIGGRFPRSVEIPMATEKLDTRVVVMNRSVPGPIGLLLLSSRLTALEPIIVTAVLILATPFGSWKRRGWALLAGMILVHGYILLRLTLFLLKTAYAAPKPYALFHPGPTTFRLIERLEVALHENPTASWLVPVVIWFLIALFTGVFDAFRGMGKPDEDAKPA